MALKPSGPWTEVEDEVVLNEIREGGKEGREITVSYSIS